MPNKTIL